MSKPQESAAQSNRQFSRRTGTAGAAFMIGLPIAASILWLFHAGPLKDTTAARYLKHEVECVELILFCCAVSALGMKLWRSVSEKAAVRAGERGDVVPTWDGQTVPVDQAPNLLAALSRLPARLKHTYLVGRVADVLDFLRARGSASELDDQLRSLADADAMAVEGSYALTRFITWAIPILGFLGTVLGITGAITGITPDKLEKDLSAVTDGLALAFDATALGLALTMVTMFLSFLVERAEQAVLEAVDRFIDHELAHRFERDGADSGEFTEVVRRQAQALIKMSETLVQRQADLWAKSFEQTEKRAAEIDQRQQQKLAAALSAAIDQTQDAHAQRVAALEKQGAERTAGLVGQLTNLVSAVRDAGKEQQTALEKQGAERTAGLVSQIASLATAVRDTGKEQQAALVPLVRGLADQVQTLARFQEGEKQMLQLQDTLNRNLASLVGALGGFEFRVRLEPAETKPDLKLHKPGKAA